METTNLGRFHNRIFTSHEGHYLQTVCLLILILLCFAPASLTQNLYEGRNIIEGKIITTDSRLIEGFNVFVSKDTVEYYDKGLTERHTLRLDQVNELQESRGNWATTGTWVGFFVGLGAGVAVALSTETTTTSGRGYYTYTETKVYTWPIYVIGFAGAGLGYLIGSNIHDWKTVYTKDITFLKSFDVYADRRLNSVCLTYRLRF